MAAVSSPWTAPVSITKTNASTTVPVVIGTAAQKFHSATLLGYKSARVQNTGTVYLQFESANSSPGIPITAGALVTIDLPPGLHLNWSMAYLDVETANDGVVIIYW